MPVFLHQLLHTLLRILLIAVGHVAQTEPHRSARDVHHGLCMHATTRQVNTGGGHQLEFYSLLMSGYLLTALL